MRRCNYVSTYIFLLTGRNTDGITVVPSIPVFYRGLIATIIFQSTLIPATGLTLLKPDRVTSSQPSFLQPSACFPLLHLQPQVLLF